MPVFILDPARYAPLLLAPGGAEALLRVLASLNRSLRARGSALLVRLGAWEEQLPALAAELGAAAVVGEQEVEAGETPLPLPLLLLKAMLPAGGPLWHAGPGSSPALDALVHLPAPNLRPEWCDGVAAVAAALGPRVALRQWQAPLCASHADDYRGRPRGRRELELLPACS